MKEFTYLIGAGASAKALPVVLDFPEKLRTFAKEIENIKFKTDYYDAKYKLEIKPSDTRVRFVNAVNWLADECENHSSVDTFARKLFLSNKKADLIKLKVVVNEFLYYKQLINGIDKRYDAFFAALLSKSDSSELLLPENIKIVSWNYDNQIEYSIAQFQYTSERKFIDNFLQVSPRSEGTAIDSSAFCLFKLNGTIGGTIINKNKYLPLNIDYNVIGKNLTEEIIENKIKSLFIRFEIFEERIAKLNYYNEDDSHDYPTITYSWENNQVFDIVRNNTLASTKNTEILVIIGYSFPTFNREIDKKILKNMEGLQKVFIQSPENSIDGVIQRFKSLYERKVSIEPITNVEEFYIPFEF